MKHIVALLLLITLSSCWQTQNPMTIERPVRTTEVTPLRDYTKEFAGEIVAPNSSDLAFGIGGTLERILVSTGQSVTKGTKLASLDPSDYALQLAAENSAYTTAYSALKRAKNMYAQDAISLQELQSTQARYDLNYARKEYAQSQLNSCVMRAPFNGFIERIEVSDFQNIGASQMILKIVDPTYLEVDFTLPQSDIEMTTLTNDFTITINGKNFSTRIKEVVDASLDGAGIPVTLSITDKDFHPAKLNIKSGFSCTVKVNIASEYTKDSYTTIPLTALFSPTNSNENFVWIYKNGEVTQRKISIEGLLGSNRVIVSSGLRNGEVVVTAGVNMLENSQKVTIEK